MYSFHSTRWLWTLGLLLGTAACNSGTMAGACSTEKDCPAGQTCVQGQCTSAPDGGLCGKAACKVGEVCRFETCIDPPASCSSDKDCVNDTYCQAGECIPWGIGPKGDHDSACTYLVPLGLFAPAKQCAWTGPPSGDAYPNHKNVLGTPMVVDFRFDFDDPQRHKPSIVFVSYDQNDGSTQSARCDGGVFGVIRIIDGGTCKQLHTLDQAQVRPSSPLALGDLNGDGRAEIVAARCGGGLAAFTYNAATGKFQLLWTSTPSDTGATAVMWDGPSIHDLDDDGKPEILMSGTAWSSEGKLLDGALGLLPVGSGFIPVAADLDGDGVVELSHGASLWKWQGGHWTAQAMSGSLTAGQVAVADFGAFGADPAKDDRSRLDGIAEIAVVSAGTVRVQTAGGRVIFGPVPIPSGGTGGPPTVGDFDRDGRAEVAAAGSDSYSVFDPDCSGTPQSATCGSLTTSGVLWTRLSQDHSSNVTGSSIFDFEGDGTAEAVYADECFTRVYEGRTGEVLFSQYRSSCTWYENPIVADVDGDFRSELVVPSNLSCETAAACTANPNHPKHPASGLTLDPLFKGLRCKAGSDCRSGTCSDGYCRCQTDADCDGDGFVCGPPVEGTPGTGQVCRSAFLGGVNGVMVYRDVLDRWANSRMIWNQHAYAVTGVNDDGTIPRRSAWKLNWAQQGLNNFRQNVQGGPAPSASPDLTAARAGELACDAQRNLTLKARLCNRGTEPVAAETPVAFYRGAPSSTNLICVAQNKSPVQPGQCEEVSCIWREAPAGTPTDVTVVADDDGSARGTTSECQEGNNTTLLKGVSCSTVD